MRLRGIGWFGLHWEIQVGESCSRLPGFRRFEKDWGPRTRDCMSVHSPNRSAVPGQRVEQGLSQVTLPISSHLISNRKPMRLDMVHQPVPPNLGRPEDHSGKTNSLAADSKTLLGRSSASFRFVREKPSSCPAPSMITNEVGA